MVSMNSIYVAVGKEWGGKKRCSRAIEKWNSCVLGIMIKSTPSPTWQFLRMCAGWTSNPIIQTPSYTAKKQIVVLARVWKVPGWRRQVIFFLLGGRRLWDQLHRLVFRLHSGAWNSCPTLLFYVKQVFETIQIPISKPIYDRVGGIGVCRAYTNSSFNTTKENLMFVPTLLKADSL